MSSTQKFKNMKNQKTVGTIPKTNRKIVKRGKIDYIHDRCFCRKEIDRKFSCRNLIPMVIKNFM